MLPLDAARVRQLLAELKAGLAEIYGERLRGVYLYGSYARGEATADSDVDVLVVLDELPPYGPEAERASELVADLSLDFGVSVSRVFMPERRWLTDEDSPFVLNVREDAVAA